MDNMEELNAAHEAFVLATGKYFAILEQWNTPEEEQTEQWKDSFTPNYIKDRFESVESNGAILDVMVTELKK